MNPMESKGRMKTPEIKIDELLEVVNTAVLEDLYTFSYNGSQYALVFDKPEEADPKYGGAQYFRSAHQEIWNIHILETLEEKEKRHRLFHEVLETNLCDQGFSVDEAHLMAVKEEAKYFGPMK